MRKTGGCRRLLVPVDRHFVSRSEPPLCSSAIAPRAREEAVRSCVARVRRLGPWRDPGRHGVEPSGTRVCGSVIPRFASKKEPVSELLCRAPQDD